MICLVPWLFGCAEVSIAERIFHGDVPRHLRKTGRLRVHVDQRCVPSPLQLPGAYGKLRLPMGLLRVPRHCDMAEMLQVLTKRGCASLVCRRLDLPARVCCPKMLSHIVLHLQFCPPWPPPIPPLPAAPPPRFRFKKEKSCCVFPQAFPPGCAPIPQPFPDRRSTSMEYRGRIKGQKGIMENKLETTTV